MAALAQLADVKQWLGLAASGDDVLLERLTVAASAFIELELGRPIAETLFDESYDGTGGPAVALPLLPGQRVSEVQSLSIDGRAIPARRAPGGSGFAVEGNLLTLVGERFAPGRRNVHIIYRAGFAAVPPELAQACVEIVGWRYRERERIGHQSKSLAGETVTFIPRELPTSASALIAKYKRVVL